MLIHHHHCDCCYSIQIFNLSIEHLALYRIWFEIKSITDQILGISFLTIWNRKREREGRKTKVKPCLHIDVDVFSSQHLVAFFSWFFFCLYFQPNKPNRYTERLDPFKNVQSLFEWCWYHQLKNYMCCLSIETNGSFLFCFISFLFSPHFSGSQT